ncbi:MAG TPA: formyltransferase family protein, partial [Propionibacteriaceae bacterium]|nr:formyltransferase family protein [Propionibacteriaceae bacterium]
MPTFVHPFVKGGDRAAWDAELTRQVAAHDVDLVVLAGFMKLVGPAFLGRFGGRMINTHPALLPSFPGMHG